MTQPEPVDHRALWQILATQIRQGIVDGVWPPGSRLIETTLAEHYGVSRGPVREALRELGREGIVAENPRRGVVVGTMTQADLKEVYELREGIESVAIREAIIVASDADRTELDVILSEMEQSWEGDDHKRSLALDFAFHRKIFEMCGNVRMMEVFDRMAAQTEILLYTAMQSDPTLRHGPPTHVHRDLLDAIVTGDQTRATDAVAAHYRYTEHRVYHGLEPSPDFEEAGDMPSVDAED